MHHDFQSNLTFQLENVVQVSLDNRTKSLDNRTLDNRTKSLDNRTKSLDNRTLGIYFVTN